LQQGHFAPEVADKVQRAAIMDGS